MWYWIYFVIVVFIDWIITRRVIDKKYWNETKANYKIICLLSEILTVLYMGFIFIIIKIYV